MAVQAIAQVIGLNIDSSFHQIDTKKMIITPIPAEKQKNCPICAKN
jgi:hypothetical protein